MLRISRTTRKSPKIIIDKASEFFGKGGAGLDEKERGSCCIYFEGIGGHVFVSIVEDEKQRNVDVETREFEYQAKQFLRRL